MSVSHTWTTWASVNGKEPNVTVHYFLQRAEPDTNTPAGVEIEQVRDMAGNYLDLDNEDHEALMQRLTAEVLG